MLAANAYPSEHLVPSHFLDLRILSLLRLYFPKFFIIVSTFAYRTSLGTFSILVRLVRTIRRYHLIWLFVLRIYVTLAVFQPYRYLEAGDSQSLKFKRRGGESNPGPLTPQAKSLTTLPPPLPRYHLKTIRVLCYYNVLWAIWRL